jgi:hypothetical protein
MNSVVLRNLLTYKEVRYVYGKIDPVICREFCFDQFGIGPLDKSELALVYSIRGRQSFSVVAHTLVFDGRYPVKAGCGKKILIWESAQS